jgi:tetratricopeptide (TPR) repeat protein
VVRSNYWADVTMWQQSNFRFRTRVSALSLAILLASSVVAEELPEAAPSPAETGSEAAAPAAAEGGPRVKRTQTMRPEIYKKLEAVREQADKSAFADAHSKLVAMDKLKMNSYEKAMVANLRAYTYFQQEEYAKVAAAYRQVLEAGAIPESLEQNTWYSLAKLYLMQEQYKESLKAMNAWFGLVQKPGADAHLLRAQVLYSLERYGDAAKDIQEAIAQVRAQGNPPRENWLLLERAILFNTRDYVALERCLKELASLYPKGQYWIQLSAVYHELGRADSEAAVLEIAYQQGMLESESHYVTLAQSLLERNIPWKSAQVLLEGMKRELVKQTPVHLSLLGDALLMAREYEQAIGVMREVAAKTGKGRDYYRLAQIHAGRQEWKECAEMAGKALNAGVEGSEGQVLLLQGMAWFQLQKLAEARVSFTRASTIESASASARQWLEYLKMEEERLAYIAAQQ